jgi:signal transduction histidine kinase
MHLFFFISIILVVIVSDATANAASTDGQRPVPVVKLVGSPKVRSTTDTVDAVISCLLEDSGDFIDLRLDAKPAGGGEPFDRDVVEHRLKIDETLSDWIIVNRGHHRVSGLKQGVYTLRVQARLLGKAWSKEVRVHLHVEGREGTSWLLYGVLTMLVVPSAYYTRVILRKRASRRLREYERVRADERRRIARDLHDDVGSGLARIVVLSDAVAAGGSSQETAAIIANTAREVIENVRTIVWVTKSENDSVDAMLSYVRDRVSELLRDHDVALIYEDEQPLIGVLNATARWNVMMCIKEIATNIVRHSKATAVRMYVSCQRGYLSIRITDNGIGFSMNLAEASGGLAHIRDRMLEIGGTAGIGSRHDEGTNILLIVPIEQHADIVNESVQ